MGAREGWLMVDGKGEDGDVDALMHTALLPGDDGLASHSSHRLHFLLWLTLKITAKDVTKALRKSFRKLIITCTYNLDNCCACGGLAIHAQLLVKYVHNKYSSAIVD